jgi:GYF domain 2
MSSAYKLRLPDGSEIGPLSLDEVKSWYAGGLVGPNDMVWKPGGARWVPLKQVLPIDDVRARATSGSPSAELRAAARAAIRPRTPAPAGRRGAASEVEAVEVQAWRTVLGGIWLLIVALGATVLVFMPAHWLPVLEETPWREIALGTAALGLALIRGWELARKVVRVVLLLAAAALFPIAGILVAQGVRGAGLLVVASAFILLGGLVAGLAGGWLPLWRSILAIVLVLAGGVGVVRYGVVAERAEAAQVRAWTRPERHFQDAARGVSLDLPSAWVALTPEQTLVAPPPGTWLVLADARRGGVAYVAFETSPQRLTEDEFLTRVLARRTLGARTSPERSDVILGALRGRQESTLWERDGERRSELTAVAKDGRNYWALTASLPDDGSKRPAHQLQALASGLAFDGRLATGLAAAVRTATDDIPCLTSVAAETVMAGAPTPVLDAPKTFRRALELAARGLGRLTAAESQEFEDLNAAACALLPKAERERLLAYLGRTRAAEPASVEDDRGMALLMKRATLSLSPPARLARLQALYEKAIRAAVAAPDKP